MQFSNLRPVLTEYGFCGVLYPLSRELSEYGLNVVCDSVVQSHFFGPTKCGPVRHHLVEEVVGLDHDRVTLGDPGATIKKKMIANCPRQLPTMDLPRAFHRPRTQPP
jgi:hypothetical protein